jgi:hypothetical protein
VACEFSYSDLNGHELFSVSDMNDNLPIPNVGETIKIERNRYLVKSVRLVPRENNVAAKEYRVCVAPVGDASQATG